MLLVAGCSARPQKSVQPQKLDQVKFDGVHRAARAVRENVHVGVTILRLRDLVGSYATEVSLAHDHMQSTIDQQFVGLHEAALLGYRQSLAVWSEKIEQNREMVWANVSQSSAGLEKLAAEYSIEPERHAYPADQLMQAIWSRAGAKLNAADALYRGEDVPQR